MLSSSPPEHIEMHARKVQRRDAIQQTQDVVIVEFEESATRDDTLHGMTRTKFNTSN